MKKISTLMLVLMALMASAHRGYAQEVKFDFTDNSLREPGTAIGDVAGFIYNETLTKDGFAMQVTAGSAPSRHTYVNNRGNCLVMYKEYATMKLTVPEGKLITKVTFTQAGSGSNLNLAATNGTLDGYTWTGLANVVRFEATATAYIADITVTLADHQEAPAIEYAEVADIAAFNALETGTYAKLTLTNAEVVGVSADGYSTVFIQDATAGLLLQYTSLNARLAEGTKVSGTVYGVKRVASGAIQLKETEDTPQSELNATDLTDLTIIEGTIDELNVPANLGRVVKIVGGTFTATSPTAGTLKVGDSEITINNGGATANQQLHKITDTWVKDETVMHNVTVVGILNAASASKNQILPLSMEEVSVPDATFDFENNNGNWPVGEGADYAVGDLNAPLTMNGVTLTALQGSSMNPCRIMRNSTRGIYLVSWKGTKLKLAAPEGKALTQVAVTMQSNSFDLKPDNGAVADNIWTGNATEVTFTNESGSRYIWRIDVTLADADDETVRPTDAVEVATIAEFNALEAGTNVKLTLTNARVNAHWDLQGSYFVEDATGATVFKGLTLTTGTALNGYVIGTKSIDNAIDYMHDTPEAVEHQLTATDASTFEATTTTLEGTVATLKEAATQANYGRLMTVENVTISGAGQNKTLTDAAGNTIKARDYLGVLPSGYTWPGQASKVTGVVVYYMTGWFLMPTSADDIVAGGESSVGNIAARSTADAPVYNLQGVRLSEPQKGVNIIGGKKVVNQ